MISKKVKPQKKRPKPQREKSIRTQSKSQKKRPKPQRKKSIRTRLCLLALLLHFRTE